MKRKIFYLKGIAILIAITTAFLSPEKTSAQINIANEAAKIQMAYKNPTYLGFDIKYTYAIETDPNTILDSSKGSFKMSGTYYWGTIDSMEFMQNGSYSIVLYKPDRIIKVNNPSYVYPPIANFSAFDSLMGNNIYAISFTTIGSCKSISLSFANPDLVYKSFSILYDSVTYHVTQIVSVMKEGFDDYADNYSRSSESSSSEYVIVKAEYTNYQTESFSNTLFNTGNYFMWNGNAYIPQPPYNDYEVFIASSNLSN